MERRAGRYPDGPAVVLAGRPRLHGAVPRPEEMFGALVRGWAFHRPSARFAGNELVLRIARCSRPARDEATAGGRDDARDHACVPAKFDDPHCLPRVPLDRIPYTRRDFRCKACVVRSVPSSTQGYAANPEPEPCGRTCFPGGPGNRPPRPIVSGLDPARYEPVHGPLRFFAAGCSGRASARWPRARRHPRPAHRPAGVRRLRRRIFRRC